MIKVKLKAVVSVEREVEVFDEDVKQSIVEELHDSVVGQCFTSQKFYYRLIN